MKLIDCLTDRLRRVVIYQVGEQVSFDETIASD
jgi:hypothetical protein